MANKAAQELGRRGGIARSSFMGYLERSEAASKAAKARWAKTTPAQRKAVMRKVRRAKKEANK